MQQIPVALLTLTAGILITLVSLWVGQNHGLMPEQASEQAPLVDDFFNIMVTIGTALFFVVQGAILIFSLKFRKPPGDETDGEPIEGNFSLEIFWTAIPALIVIGLGIYSVEVYQRMGGLTISESGSMMAMAHHHSPKQGSHGTDHPIAKQAGTAMAAPLIAESSSKPETGQASLLDAVASASGAEHSDPVYGIQNAPEAVGKPADLTVNVTGIQFAWIFNYPDSGVTTGELHVPIGKDVQLNLAAQDVIHSLWVPQFRLKQDAIPGEKTELRFVATKLGEYPIVCTELCGSYHGAMRTKVIVQTPDAYEQWLAASQVAMTSNLEPTITLAQTHPAPEKLLATYTQEMGITSDTLAQVHHTLH
jgi:cytochrome c oxidase subunit 2